MRSRVFIGGAVFALLASICTCACQPFSAGGTTPSPSSGSSDDGGVGGDGSALTPPVVADGSLGEDAPRSWCADHNPSGAAFCSDFEGVATVLDPGWEQRVTPTKGLVALSTTQASSPSHAARMTIAATGGAPCEFAEIIYRNKNAATQGHLEFDVWFGDTTKTTVLRFGGNCAVDLTLGDDSSMSIEIDLNGTDGGSKNFNVPIPRKTWTHVTIDVDFAVPSYTARHSADPTPIEGIVINASCKGTAITSADLGIHCPGSGNQEVYIDNVVMTPR